MRKETIMYKKMISDFIDNNKDNMIETLRTLVKIPSVRGKAEENMPFGKANAEVLEKALDICKNELQMDTKNFDNYAGTADYMSRDNEPALGILFHLDVVPEGTGWTYNPFDVTEKDGNLIGRGTIDDKGPGVSVLYAIKAIKECGIKLNKNFRLIMGCDEENGSGDLEYYIKKEELPENLFTPDGDYPVLNMEKGMIRSVIKKNFKNTCAKRIISFKAGVAINAVPEIATAKVVGISADEINSAISKLGIDVKFDVAENKDFVEINAHGKSAHASKPFMGVNSLTAMIKLLSQLPFDNSDSKDCINALAELYPFGETDGTCCNVKCSDEKSGELTLLLSVIDYTEQGMTAHTDIRFPCDQTSQNIISRYSEKAKSVGLEYETDMAVEPHYVDENNDFIQTLLSVYEDIKGEKGYCVAIGGLTYVHDTKGGVAFGVEYADSNHNMHGADEFTTIDELVFNAKMYAEAIIRLCS